MNPMQQFVVYEWSGGGRSLMCDYGDGEGDEPILSLDEDKS